MDLWRDIYEMPVLVSEGSIIPRIPLKDMEGYDNSIENPEKLEVLVENPGNLYFGKTVGTHRKTWMRTGCPPE